MRLPSWLADAVVAGWERLGTAAAITRDSNRSDRFADFGAGSMICFPAAALFGESGIRIGDDTLIGPYISISAGMAPSQSLLSDRIVDIGNRCLIGRGSSIVGHLSIRIEDDVYFGPNVYVTDQNHGHTDLAVPIGHQSAPEKPVSIGAGSWIGTNAVILPGVSIGRHVVVGAGSIVTGDLPDFSIAAGVPARVVGSQLDDPDLGPAPLAAP